MVEGRDRSVARTPGWQLIQAFYVLLLGVSAVGFLAPPLDTREGRWGVWARAREPHTRASGRGRNTVCLSPASALGVVATGLCYGLPMTLIDHLQVGWMGLVSVLEFLLLALWATGLMLGSRTIFEGSRGTDDSEMSA